MKHLSYLLILLLGYAAQAHAQAPPTQQPVVWDATSNTLKANNQAHFTHLATFTPPFVPISGPGVANECAYWINATSLGASANCVWNIATSRLGLGGIASPVSLLQLKAGDLTLDNNHFIYLDGGAPDTNWGLGMTTAADIRVFGSGSGARAFRIMDGGVSGTSRFSVNIATGLTNITQSALIKGPNPWADVLAWGATCDGTVNDTTGIQNALDSGAGEVRLPGGTCRITTITMPSSVSLIGAGTGSTTLKRLSGTADMIVLARDTTNVRLRHFKLDGNNADGNGIVIGDHTYGTFDLSTSIILDYLACDNFAVSSSSKKACVFADAASKVIEITNSTFNNGSVHIYNYKSSPPLYIKSVVVRAAANACILAEGTGSNLGSFGLLIFDSYIFGCRDGVSQTSLSQLHLTGNYVESNTRYGIHADSVADVKVNNNFGDVPASAIWLDLVGEVTPLEVLDNVIPNATLTTGIPIKFTSFPASPTYPALIANNSVTNTALFSLPTSTAKIAIYGNKISVDNVFALQGRIGLTGVTTLADDIAIANDDTSGANIKLTHTGATNPNKYIRAHSGAFEIINSAYNATLFFMDNSGNVGIGGQTAPQYHLHVGAGNDAPNLAPEVYITNNGATYLTIRDSTNHVEYAMGANSGQVLFGSRTNHKVSIQANGSNYWEFAANGGMVVGSALPTSQGDGTINVKTGYYIDSVAGVSGSVVSGGCTVTITKGLVTGLSGC